jgi:mediator of RNA polymerase II transcription subunit 12
VLPMSSNDWYSQEFTNMFTAWLRIQLGQLVLPSTSKTPAKASVPSAKGPVGILGDEKGRARWLTKWEYR